MRCRPLREREREIRRDLEDGIDPHRQEDDGQPALREVHEMPPRRARGDGEVEGAAEAIALRGCDRLAGDRRREAVRREGMGAAHEVQGLRLLHHLQPQAVAQGGVLLGDSR